MKNYIKLALKDIRETREYIMEKLRENANGEATAEETAQIGYAGLAVAHLSRVEYEIAEK